jgi:dienelactone hydrolase
MRRLSFALSLLVLALPACREAGPPSSAPAASATATLAPSTAADERDPLTPELVTFPSGPLQLHGFLYRPVGAGPFPAIVFNHGSEKLPGDKRGQAMFYVRHGFVLFVPHRRGQGRSADAGPYIGGTSSTSHAFSDALVEQSDDVMAAVAFVASRPYVDAKRVAVAGCSLGGIQSLLAAERGTGIVAAVDFAGAAITWSKNEALRERMRSAARNARVPVLFLQAENDYDTAPSRVLSDEMKAAGKRFGVHVFPPNGTTHEEGHSFCIGGDHPPWGDDVLAFLAEAMGAPAP